MTENAVSAPFWASRRLVLAGFLMGTIVVPGCLDDDPCDPGQVVAESGFCFDDVAAGGASGEGDCYPGTNAIKAEWEAEDAAASSSRGGAGGVGGDSSSEPERVCANWGADCETNEECVGGLACGADGGLPVCTQGFCNAGEENEGICPPGFTCITAGSQSGCVP